MKFLAELFGVLWAISGLLVLLWVLWLIKWVILLGFIVWVSYTIYTWWRPDA